MDNRVTFEILGFGKRMNGVSQKTGKPYDFQPVSFAYASPGYTGMACVTLNLSGSQLAQIKDLSVGAYVDAVIYHDRFRGIQIAYIF